MIKCTCETRPVFNCLVHADRNMAHRQSVSRWAGLKQENAELEQQLAELSKHAHAMATSVGCTSKAFRDYWDYVEQQEESSDE